MEELSRLGSQGRLPDLPHRCRATAELTSIRQDPPTGRANRFPQLFELRSVMLSPPQTALDMLDAIVGKLSALPPHVRRRARRIFEKVPSVELRPTSYISEG